ncbi:MAG: DUF2147 domain-containing protein [Treponema sp.]|nr:DUF2147 domain-containing protein [Treponema sp.]MCL2266360.1 DUF2147 domain-containing protein [Treponema sp.]
MKKFFIFLTVLAAAAVCFAQSEPVEGYWLSVDENTGNVTAGWQIYIENNVLYGKILSMTDFPPGLIAERCKASYSGFPIAGRVNTMPVIGTPWIFGLTKQRNGTWSGGNVINPEDGGIYSARITFHPAGSSSGRRTFNVDTLEMYGSVLIFGRSQFWTRTDQRTASGLYQR